MDVIERGPILVDSRFSCIRCIAIQLNGRHVIPHFPCSTPFRGNKEPATYPGKKKFPMVSETGPSENRGCLC